MRVLITGAAGFIGSHLAEHWAAEGATVVGIDNLSAGRAYNFPNLGGDLCVGDIADRSVLDVHVGAFKPDVIYHCAGSFSDPDGWETDVRTNVLGTVNVVRVAQETGAKVVYFQTSLCYGLNPGADPVRTDRELAPTGSYAVSKTAGERYIADSGIDYVSLRLANIYGPRNLAGPVPTFYRRLKDGHPVTVVDSRRDYLFIGDLLPVAIAAAGKGEGVFHVAHGTDMAILDLYRGVVEAMGLELPDPVVTPRHSDDAATILLDPIATEEFFGWKPVTPLADGIAAAVDWYQRYGVTKTYTHLRMKEPVSS